jgi:hypothetical protein
MSEFIFTPLVTRKGYRENTAERHLYKCRDCGEVQGTETPWDDMCIKCNGTNCEYIGVRER